MTTLQKTLVTATIVLLAGVGIYEARQASQLRNQVQMLQQQQAPLAGQIQQLQRERDAATNRLVDLIATVGQSEGNSGELLRLRSQVAQMRSLEEEKKTLAQALSAVVPDAMVTISKRERRLLELKKAFAEDLESSVGIFWSHHGMRMPASFDEALAYSDLQQKTRETAKSNDLSIDQFELIGNEIPPVISGDPEFSLILILREKQPVQWYDGKWVRVYVDSASGARIATSTNGDFNAWERDNMVVRVRKGSEITGIYNEPE